MEKHECVGDLKFIIFLFTERNRPQVGHTRADCDFGCWTEEVDRQ